MWRSVALVSTEISEDHIDSTIGVKRISELAVTSSLKVDTYKNHMASNARRRHSS
jgi:hypothetical protein